MRRALVAAILVITCGGVLAAEKETRQQKIDRLCSEGKWEEAEPYTVAELASLEAKKDWSAVKNLRLRRAEMFNSQKKWQDALREIDAAKHIRPSESLFRVYTQKGIAHFGMGDYLLAESSFRSALDYAPHGPDHIETAATLMQLAEVYLADRKGDLAKPILQRAMVIYEENLGDDAPRTKEARERLAKANEQANEQAKQKIEIKGIKIRD